MGGFVNSVQGLGEPTSQAIANPPVATDITIDVPNNEIWKVLAFVYTLTCDANAGNRGINIIATVGGNSYRNYSKRILTANDVERHDWVADRQDYFIATGNYPVGSNNYRLSDIWLNGRAPGTNRLATNTNALQAGDQYSDIVIVYRRWRF